MTASARYIRFACACFIAIPAAILLRDHVARPLLQGIVFWILMISLYPIIKRRPEVPKHLTLERFLIRVTMLAIAIPALIAILDAIR